MYKLPLFPLNLVLFPATPVRLHIFEERYRLMINQCIEQKQPFGVVALRQGSEVEGYGLPTEPYSIGCSAVITEVQRLYDGRMNIVARGFQRFRIAELDHSQPYLVGIVEDYPLDLTMPSDLERAGRRLRPWVERYFKLLARAENLEVDVQRIPTDPSELAFLSASLLKLPTIEKQALLSAPTLISLIEKLHPQYRKEATILDLLLSPERVREEGPFSLN
jgi:Lon protease-like protein